LGWCTLQRSLKKEAKKPDVESSWCHVNKPYFQFKVSPDLTGKKKSLPSQCLSNDKAMKRLLELVKDEPNLWEEIGYDGRAHVYEMLSQMARADDAAANLALLFMGLTSQENHAERIAHWSMVLPQDNSMFTLYVDLFAVAMEKDSEETFDLLVTKVRGDEEFRDSPGTLGVMIGRAAGRNGMLTTKWWERAFPYLGTSVTTSADAPMFYQSTATGMIEGAHWAELDSLMETYVSEFSWFASQQGLREIVRFAATDSVDALKALKVSKMLPHFINTYAYAIAESAAFVGRIDIIEWLFTESVPLVAVEEVDDYAFGLVVYEGACRGNQLHVLNFALQHWLIARYESQLRDFYLDLTPDNLSIASWLLEHGIALPTAPGYNLYHALTADNLMVADWLFEHGAPLPHPDDIPFSSALLLLPPLAVIKWFVAHGAIPSPRIYKLAATAAVGTTAYLDALFELGVPLPQEPLTDSFYPESAADIIRVLDWFRGKGVPIAEDSSDASDSD